MSQVQTASPLTGYHEAPDRMVASDFRSRLALGIVAAGLVATPVWVGGIGWLLIRAAIALF